MAGVSGGNALSAQLQALVDKVKSASRVDVGYFEESKYPDGTPVAFVAAIQEFGAPSARIPARPFFRKAIEQNSADWGRKMAALLDAHGLSAEKALDTIGSIAAQDIQMSISDLTTPPLSPVTLMLRKMKKKKPGLEITGKVVGEAARLVKAGKSYAGVSTKPLIEPGGGDLLRAVGHKVISEGESE